MCIVCVCVCVCLVCLVCVCVSPSQASPRSVTVKVIIIKLGTVTASDTVMHHVLIIIIDYDPSFKVTQIEIIKIMNNVGLLILKSV